MRLKMDKPRTDESLTATEVRRLQDDDMMRKSLAATNWHLVNAVLRLLSQANRPGD
jgi:hypothetical protein